ncbi:uncharacterized protein KLLA0_A04323g [Kluyveromyces lactis]|uniref:KLLA0A04323p n=1 Tax=Kluyveromyces lactis (strain ATCC 8585 / CBS 2359 / DSM 70799 / NBRC 1267 / NRRL Y-1140 / WM37) TaxID=284590 RepID=Q6CY00_KLULA|nr:uncharacterized protein KLLA0_A04323g [Kluyveromyces lactis]CAH02777.1 KLLA0A04323p [Kluyveromyces lactis]|eukprot:XP_451189.1 uncharacterized protein KLLA0_A04323g [Kluyveromyces lactis]
MKFSTVAATALAASSSALAAQTVITATNDGVVYTKTIDLAETDATLAPGEYLTSIVVTRGDTVYTKVITESSAAATEETTAAAEETTAAAETTSAAAETTTAAPAEETSSAQESETITLTLSKNGHWFTKTVTQAVGYVWTGEDTANWTGTPSWLSNITTSTSAAETTEAASSTAEVATYTGAAALASVGTGLLGVAVAGLLI